jgi:serine/threonine protein phosphatase PrpC
MSAGGDEISDAALGDGSSADRARSAGLEAGDFPRVPEPGERLSWPFVTGAGWESLGWLGLELDAGTAWVYVGRSPGKEPGAGEDALAVVPLADERALLAVADGLGGHAGGAEAAGIVVGELAACAGLESGAVREAVLDALDRAHRLVLGKGTGAGATVALALVGNQRLRALHAGDAGVFAVGQRGSQRLWTVPHSPVGYALEAGLLDEQQALDHDERHLVSNYVGMQDMHLQLGSEVELRPRDTVVVASDGLFDNFSLDELTQRVRKGPLARVSEALGAELRERMLGSPAAAPCKPDDHGLILFRPR